MIKVAKIVFINTFKVLLPLILILGACKKPGSLSTDLAGLPFIEGSETYLSSPYVTAGDRLYMVGYQNGSFPDLGWHIEGEMGGVWMHPIKLLDGFDFTLRSGKDSIRLNNAVKFINYPVGNSHIFQEKDLLITRFQFVPDASPAVVVKYEIENTSSETRTFDVEFQPNFDLRPTWLGDSTGMKNDKDTLVTQKGGLLAKDLSNQWYSFVKSYELQPYLSKSIRNKLKLTPGEKKTLSIVISGSTSSPSDAIEIAETVMAQTGPLLKSKISRLQDVAHNTVLESPDSLLNQTFKWLKYNTDWLVRDVPGIGRGISAGIPDYPWWFGVDSEYALKGILATGNKEIVYETIDLITRLSEKANGNGRIIHEVSTNGFVFNKGNINETPQYVSLIRFVYDWTGDLQFLKKYYPYCKKGLTWVSETQDADQNLIPEGFGMMEIHGLNSEMIDVASYTAKAYSDMSEMALILGEEEYSKECNTRFETLKKRINDDFWVPEYNSYADFIGTPGQARELLKSAKERATELNKPWAITELLETEKRIKGNDKKGFVIYHNWVVNTPMEMKLAPEDKAISALKTAEKFTNPYGMFVTGIDRDETDGTNEGTARKKIFSYVGAVMTLPTGVQAIAENNYGRPDAALSYLKKMCKSFSYALPGSMYEVSPDFGMMTQAWNMYAFGIPVITQFFGIQPEGREKVIYLNPVFPKSWPSASLSNVRVGDQTFDIVIKKDEDGLIVKVKTSNNGWKFALDNNQTTVKELWVNDQKI